jgi:PPM family protein phosphatase
MSIVVRSFGETRPHIGPEDQHDAILRDEGHGLFAVASGVPRSALGAVAAREVLAVLYGEVDGLCHAMDETASKRASWASFKELVTDVLERASERVRLHSSSASSGPTASVSMALLRNGHAAVAHVGRTRAYFIRKGKIVRLSQGPSEGSTVAQAGKPGKAPGVGSNGKPAIDHSLGQAEAVSVDGVSFRVKGGDRMMLVSETITEVVRGDQIRRLSTMSPDATTLGREILDLAGGLGADGDVSCVVMCLSDPAAQAQTGEQLSGEAGGQAGGAEGDRDRPSSPSAGLTTPTGVESVERHEQATALGAPSIRESPKTAENALELDLDGGDLAAPQEGLLPEEATTPGSLFTASSPATAGHSGHGLELDGALDALRDKLGSEVVDGFMPGDEADEDLRLTPSAPAPFPPAAPMSPAHRHRTTLDIETDGGGAPDGSFPSLAAELDGATVVSDEAAFLAEMATGESSSEKKKERSTADYEVDVDGESDPDDPLRSVCLFDGVGAEQRLAITEAIITYTLRTDQLLYEEEDEADEIYVVASGRVQLTQSGRPVGSVGAGEIFGEDCLLEGQVRQFSVRARKQSCLNAIPVDVLQGMMERDPQLATRLFQNLANLLARKLR